MKFDFEIGSKFISTFENDLKFVLYKVGYRYVYPALEQYFLALDI